MQAVIFGGTGFLGSHAVETLVRDGHDVLAATRSAKGGELLRSLGATPVEIDYGDETQLANACAGREVALICVADPRLHQPLTAMREVEVLLTRRLVRIAGQAGVRRVVQLSSVQVYGFDRPPTPIDEDHPCVATHAFNQVCQEREEAVRDEARQHGMELVILRPTNALGRRDRSFLPPIMQAHERGLYPFMGDPDTPFSCIDARDVGRALAWAATSDEAAGQTLLCRGFDTTWAEVKATLDGVTGRRSRSLVMSRRFARGLAAVAEAVTPRSIDLPLTRMAVDVTSVPTLFDDRRIRGLGWTPRHSLRDALEDALRP